MPLTPPSDAERASGLPGKMAATTIVSYQGRVKTEKWVNGTYTVNPDCTVKVKYLATGGVPGDLELEWWGVLVDAARGAPPSGHDRELRFIVSAPLLGPLMGTLVKQ